MKPYGLPRNKDVEYPDVADIQAFGLKSCVGSPTSKGGDRRSLVRKSAAKRQTRRIFKKAARRSGRVACKETF